MLLQSKDKMIELCFYAFSFFPLEYGRLMARKGQAMHASPPPCNYTRMYDNSNLLFNSWLTPFSA